MKLSDFICFDALVPQLSANDRDGAIVELAEALSKTKAVKGINAKKISDSVIERENEASTGMGRGVAVPHAKIDKLKDVVAAVGRKEEGLDFNSLDKKPVYSVILLLSPKDKPDRHLQAMECIFANLQKEDFRKFLRQCVTAEQIKEVITDADEKPAV